MKRIILVLVAILGIAGRVEALSDFLSASELLDRCESEGVSCRTGTMNPTNSQIDL